MDTSLTINEIETAHESDNGFNINKFTASVILRITIYIEYYKNYFHTLFIAKEVALRPA